MFLQSSRQSRELSISWANPKFRMARAFGNFANILGLRMISDFLHLGDLARVA
jgi:hypothetical protein